MGQQSSGNKAHDAKNSYDNKQGLGSIQACFCTSMASRSITALDIQSHLYTCFLQGQTADVHLRVSGRWRAIYRLHRVVLIQSVWPFRLDNRAPPDIFQDFFRALFTSEFRESQDSQKRLTGSLDVDVVFDDTNITRAGAFRYGDHIMDCC